MNVVVVIYPSDHYFEFGVLNKKHIDRRLEKIAGKSSDGSGMGCGERDMSFSFKSKKKAEWFVNRASRFSGVRASLQD